MKTYIVFLISALLFTGTLSAESDESPFATKLTEYERKIVASCLVLEAASDGEEGMRAVLNVAFNRADRDPAKVVLEVLKRGQFTAMRSVWSGTKPDYSPLLTRAAHDRMYPTAVRLVYLMELGRLEDNTGGSTHYFHKAIDAPEWSRQMTFRKTIGSHHFFVDRIEIAKD